MLRSHYPPNQSRVTSMKILLADDHSLVRDGLSHALKQLDPDVEILEAKDTDETLALAGQHEDIDMILLDVSMPGMNHLEGLEQIRHRRPSAAIVLLTAHEDSRLMQDALRRGAKGYIPKSTTTEAMLDALRLVLTGGIYVPTILLTERARQETGGSENRNDRGAVTHRESVTPAVSLTNRQQQILKLLIEGGTNKEIGRLLGLSEATVRTHVSLIFQKLNVRNRTQASHVAMRLGMVPDEDRSS
jgi:DNA-binding NarL/FixJ family response regulator